MTNRTASASVIGGEPTRPGAALLSTRDGALVVGAAVIAALLSFLPSPGVLESYDVFRQLEAYRHYGAQAISAGRLPLWNPHVALGRPFLADIESALFYPPHLLYLFLSVKAALTTLVLLHAALLATSTAALCRQLGVARVPSLVCGVSFATSGPVVATTLNGNISVVFAACWMSLVWLLAVRLVQRPGGGRLALLSVAVAAQILCGSPQISWMTALLVFVFLLTHRLERPWRTALRRVVRKAGWLMGAMALGLAVTAVQLLPFLELVSESVRRTSSLSRASAYAITGLGWLSLLRPADPTLYPVSFSKCLFAGSAITLAGLGGLILVRGSIVRAVVVSMLLFAGIAAGEATFASSLLFRVVPGLGFFRLHSRAGFVLILLLTLSAGLVASRMGRMRRLHALVFAGIGALALVLLFRAGLAQPWVVGAIAINVALLSVLIVNTRRVGDVLAPGGCHGWRGVARRVAPWLLVVVVAAESATSVAGLRRTALRIEPTSEAEVLHALRDRGLLASSLAPPRVSMPYPWVRETAGMRHGWSTFTQYGPLPLRRTWNYIHNGLGLPTPVLDDAIPSDEIYRTGAVPFRSMNLVMGFDTRRMQGGPVRAPDPRFYLVHGITVVADDAEAIQRMRAGHDFHVSALVERQSSALVALPEAAGRGAIAAEDDARLVKFAPELVEVEVKASGPALLVLAEAWYPGWSATVNGREVPCLPVNAWMRGIPVPAGNSVVICRYRSTLFGLGALMSLCGVLLVASLLWRDRVRSSVADAGDRGASTRRTRL